MKFRFFSFVLVLAFCFIFCGCNEYDLVEASSKNIDNYDISVKLDYGAKTLNAVETVDYLNKTDNTLNEVKFHLYPNAFSEKASKYKAVSPTQSAKAYSNGFSEGSIAISNVKIGSKTVDFEVGGIDNNILTVPIVAGLKSHCYAQIQIEFSLVIPNCNHRFGYGENALNLGNWYPIACVFEDDNWIVDGYSTNGDPFYSEISNYQITIDYDDNLILASTGNIISTTEAGNIKSTIMQAKAVRDFAIVLSTKFNTISEKVGDTLINYYYYDDEKSAEHLQTSVDAVKTFNSMIGLYPYDVLNVVKTNFLQGGMEYPNLVYISDKLINEADYNNVIIHEIAHQWWYGVVGSNECEYAWLDEGLTEYVTALFYDKNEGYTITTRDVLNNALNAYLLFSDVYREVYGELNTSMNRGIHDYSTETEYVYLTYVKGLLMFDSIADIVGASKMEKCLQEYFESCAMTNAKPADMIACFERASHKSLSSFIMSWLDGSVVLEELSN